MWLWPDGMARWVDQGELSEEDDQAELLGQCELLMGPMGL